MLSNCLFLLNVCVVRKEYLLFIIIYFRLLTIALQRSNTIILVEMFSEIYRSMFLKNFKLRKQRKYVVHIDGPTGFTEFTG